MLSCICSTFHRPLSLCATTTTYIRHLVPFWPVYCLVYWVSQQQRDFHRKIQKLGDNPDCCVPWAFEEFSNFSCFLIYCGTFGVRRSAIEIILIAAEVVSRGQTPKGKRLLMGLGKIGREITLGRGSICVKRCHAIKLLYWTISVRIYKGFRPDSARKCSLSGSRW